MISSHPRTNQTCPPTCFHTFRSNNLHIQSLFSQSAACHSCPCTVLNIYATAPPVLPPLSRLISSLPFHSQHLVSCIETNDCLVQIIVSVLLICSHSYYNSSDPENAVGMLSLFIHFTPPYQAIMLINKAWVAFSYYILFLQVWYDEKNLCVCCCCCLFSAHTYSSALLHKLSGTSCCGHSANVKC